MMGNRCMRSIAISLAVIIAISVVVSADEYDDVDEYEHEFMDDCEETDDDTCFDDFTAEGEAACVELPSLNVDSADTCPDCLKAIMNGNPDNHELACRQCVQEHGFDCHCSCETATASAGGAVTHQAPQQTENGASGGDDLHTDCVEKPQKNGDTCKVCVNAIMNGNPKHRELACHDCVEEHAFDCGCTCAGVIDTGGQYRPKQKIAGCVEKLHRNGDACPVCLAAIMNGNSAHRQRACNECTQEHGFDCHCSCTDVLPEVAVGTHRRSPVPTPVPKPASQTIQTPYGLPSAVSTKPHIDTVRTEADDCVEENHPNTCPDCLKAIMNGNPDNHELACRQCVQEHGFDCHCSCEVATASAGGAVTHQAPQQTENGASGGDDLHTDCVENPQKNGDTCKVCVNAIMNGNPKHRELACHDCVEEHAFDCGCTCADVLPEVAVETHRRSPVPTPAPKPASQTIQTPYGLPSAVSAKPHIDTVRTEADDCVEEKKSNGHGCADCLTGVPDTACCS
jgi:hypothetical protein